MTPKDEQSGRTTVKPSMSPAEIAANARLQKQAKIEKVEKILTSVFKGVKFAFEEWEYWASFHIMPAPECPFGLQRDPYTQICFKKGH